MDAEIFNKVLRSLGVDLWSLIDTAISVAVRDHGKELKLRRDGIVERLYSARVEEERVQSRGVDEKGKRDSPSVTSSPDRDEGDEDGADTEEEIEDEQIKILAIKEHLEDADQDEESLVRMLQALTDMDIKFKILQATDIGRQVNALRKHPSAEVRRLVKHLVRKWKEMVDDWVKKNSVEAASEGEPAEQIHADVRQNKSQIPDFGLSPSIQSSDREVNWSSSRSNREAEPKSTAGPIRKEAPTPPTPPLPIRSTPSKEPKDTLEDPEKLASARRRLHENYQEAENAKKQRTIQVMDIHDIPRPKNSFLRRDHKGHPGNRK